MQREVEQSARSSGNCERMTDFNVNDGANRLEGLGHRAKVFRSKLIEDFQILETTSEKGKRKVPVYSTTDILSKAMVVSIVSFNLVVSVCIVGV